MYLIFQKEQDITCQKNLTELTKIFNSFNKNVDANEKHFKIMRIFAFFNDPFTLEDGIFGEITFEQFAGYNLNKIGSNVFNKSADKITMFSCHICNLENRLNYNLNRVFDQMTKLEFLAIGLDNEIPSIGPPNLQYLMIGANEFVVKSDIFENLKKSKIIGFYDTIINQIQRNAFKINTNLTNQLSIQFYHCQINNDTFINGSFDGTQRPIDIQFDSMVISHLDEGAFKSVLDNKNNSIVFGAGLNSAVINCDDCKNYWLIKEGKEKQVKNAKCKGEDKNLFDDEIKSKLSQKCK